MRRQSEAIREAINGHSGVPQQHNHLAKHISDVEVSAAAPLDTASDVPRDGSRAIRRRRERARAYNGGLINMHVPKEASAHLHACSEAISGNRWQSVAIERPARWASSVAINGNQWQSVAISGNQWPSNDRRGGRV